MGSGSRADCHRCLDQYPSRCYTFKAERLPDQTWLAPVRKPRPASGTLVRFRRGRLVHHTQHFRPAGFQEAPHQEGRQTEKRDVEPGRVILSDGRLDHPCLALRRDEGEAVKDQLDDQRRYCHGDVKGGEEEAGHLHTVILAIDV